MQVCAHILYHKLFSLLTIFGLIHLRWIRNQTERTIIYMYTRYITNCCHEVIERVVYVTSWLLSDTCKVQPAFQKFVKHCRNGYNWMDDDAKDYLPGWKMPGDDLPPLTGNETRPEVKEVKHDKKSSWVYRNSVETKTAPYSGAITMYKVRAVTQQRSSFLIDDCSIVLVSEQ